MNDENRIIYRRADENDEAQHGQHIERLRWVASQLHVPTEQIQTKDTADRRQRHAEDNNQRINP